MISWLFFLLSIRSFLLAWQEKKPTFFKAVDVAMGTLSLVLFFLIPGDFQWKPFALSAALIALFLYRRLSLPPQQSRFSFQNTLGFVGLYTAGIVAAVSAAFFKLGEDEKIAKVILTGKNQPTWVEWKNPFHAHTEGAWLNSYEVIIQDTQGKEICREFIYGDLVGLRAEVIAFRSPLHLLGLKNLCRLEMLYNGYQTAARHNLFPHTAAPLPFPRRLLQQLWEKLYHNEWKIPGICTASLESSYLSLSEQERAYWLVVGTSGLTAIAE